MFGWVCLRSSNRPRTFAAHVRRLHGRRARPFFFARCVAHYLVPAVRFPLVPAGSGVNGASARPTRARRPRTTLWWSLSGGVALAGNGVRGRVAVFTERARDAAGLRGWNDPNRATRSRPIPRLVRVHVLWRAVHCVPRPTLPSILYLGRRHGRRRGDARCRPPYLFVLRKRLLGRRRRRWRQLVTRPPC